MSIKEIAKSLLLKGVHINKSEFHKQYQTFTLTQRIEEIRKDGWDVRSKVIPGRKGMVEYWLEPNEIERIKTQTEFVEARIEEDEQLHFNTEKTAPEQAEKAQNAEYEQLGIGILGGRNY